MLRVLFTLFSERNQQMKVEGIVLNLENLMYSISVQLLPENKASFQEITDVLPAAVSFHAFDDLPDVLHNI